MGWGVEGVMRMDNSLALVTVHRHSFLLSRARLPKPNLVLLSGAAIQSTLLKEVQRLRQRDMGESLGSERHGRVLGVWGNKGEPRFAGGIGDAPG
jgi:hypothetical protein